MNGVWKALVKTDTGSIELTYVMKADGDTVTGAVESPSGRVSIEQGKVSGDGISFAALMDDWKVSFWETVNGDEMTLTWVACCEGSRRPRDLGQAPIVAKRIK